MKKITKIVVILSLIFGLTISSFWGENNSVKAAAPQGGYVAATTVYSGTGQSQNVPPTKTVDMFMNVNDANSYAAKLNAGWKQSIAWAVAGWMAGVGPYLGIVASIDTISAQKAAADITKLTDKNKKVQITSTSTVAFLTVKEWDGKESSIKTSAPPSKTTSWGGVTAIIKTTVDKKETK
ncbi:hypothetical protein BFM98_20475 [Lysinibacillus sp. AR18-8]|uniref:hypothetical protein n=1 Tax=Lysinibacillus sp. AR18-8 TaxID=1889781 RepID=UPI0008270E86|nr:hypothetical protein [Lysinibacillus sp. AR18-8]OCX60522.1 hypothetical protein BFM98_20475 [Lysinibacillus sp. AR18-8]